MLLLVELDLCSAKLDKVKIVKVGQDKGKLGTL